LEWPSRLSRLNGGDSQVYSMDLKLEPWLFSSQESTVFA